MIRPVLARLFSTFNLENRLTIGNNWELRKNKPREQQSDRNSCVRTIVYWHNAWLTP